MTTRTALGIGVALIALAITTYASISNGMESTQRLSSDGIKEIKIFGGNTGLRIVGKQNETDEISIKTSDTSGCRIDAETIKKGDVLTVRLVRNSRWPFGWCDPETSVVLPERMDVNIRLDRLAAEFTGIFNDFTVLSEKSVIYFNGAASSFELTGDMAAVYLKFTEEMGKNDIHLNVDRLVSDLNFSGGWRSATSILREIF